MLSAHMGGAGASDWVHRTLGLVGTEPAEVSEPRLLAFRRFLLLVAAAESWHALHYPAYQESVPLHVALAITLTLSCAAGFSRRFARPACAAAALCMLVDLASVFPENANHQYVGLLAMVFLALADDGDEAQRVAALQGLRWLLLIGLFWAGVQKVVYGLYFEGEFLAVRIATDPNFAEVFGWLLPEAEHARLLSLQPGAGVGPYRVDAPLFVAASNSVWIAEIGLPVLLLIPATRRWAVPGVIALMAAIELAARELFFGAIMVSLALLFARADWSSRALPFLAVAIAVLMLSSAGVLPRWSFG